VYAPRYRSEWLAKITEAGVHRRAEIYYEQLDALRSLREQVRRDLLVEGRKHSAMKLLRQIPSIGPLRAVLLIALLQTPHRFRTKRQLWAYSGLALKTSTSGEYRIVGGQLKRSKKFLAVRGLNTHAKAYVERLIGSIRREGLDHVIVLKQTGVHRVLKSYFQYYERTRTQLSLEKDAPIPRRVQPPDLGKVVELPEVGGLHHRYERRAA
jgi:hypothetical protein